jgi:fatty acid desaturase
LFVGIKQGRLYAWVFRSLCLHEFHAYARHLTHHHDPDLTLPGVDPESNYMPRAEAAHMGGVARFLAASQRTVLGRLALGPGLVIAQLARNLLKALRQPHSAQAHTLLRAWAVHGALLAALMWVLAHYAQVAVWQYIVLTAYPALGLAMLRSLYEHRPAALPAHRIVVNESGWLWRLLYLNNNYHAVHHAHPGLAWYRISRTAGLTARDTSSAMGAFE